MGELTEKQVRVYEIIFNMFMRLVLTGAGITAFFMVLNQLIVAPSADKATYAFMETLIAGTTFWPYRFYFSFANKQSPQVSVAPASQETPETPA